MATKNTKMGFEGELYYGVAGQTAATKITNCRDVTIGIDPEKGDTTTRGDGSGPVVNSSRVVALSASLEWTMVNKADDTTLAALLAAAASGTPVALRGKDYAAGKGPDMDYTLAVQNGQPYKGEQTYQFTAEPTDEAGRTPTIASLYV
jgi:hypothetical protein